ncbi:hypothetical protein MKZ38_007447 [Zalerion maritima]|uniref:FCP1 homology domain-containing protein n=1 Tax=Zalerion maritima TaxID=339359 RepID=A0AAD5WP63_9PEZI|nr:hypothetical protein MKZ38_007447 [Zalerion maritima]
MASEFREKPQQEIEGSGKDREMLSPGETAPAKTRKGRNLLPVPSRSTSQKIQPSPTSTGLSGATAQDPRDSIGGQSKESKGSIINRHRNGTASSNHSGDVTGPTNTPGSSLPASPTAGPQKRKKGGGILSLFGCCGVPQDANAVDGTDEAPLPPHKVERIPNRPATASHRTATPSEQSKNQPYEKEPQPQMAPTSGAAAESSKAANRASGSSSQAQPQPSTQGAAAPSDSLPEDNEKAAAAKPTQADMPMVSGGGGPVVTVDAPPPTTGSELTQEQAEEATTAKDEDGDVQMPDAENENRATNAQTTDAYTNNLPPPPPGPAPANSQVQQDASLVATEQPQQKYLLPPIRPEFKGKKCLVLDLDETLVHSSFKILHQADFTIPVEIEGNFHNVYVIKRPGVDEFMKRVGELYEVVVFTASVSKYGDPLLDQLDIHGVVHHRLFRESCYNHQGNYVKDLSQVGRDLKDTIIIDNSPTSYIFHPQHAVPISSWFSDAHDNELLDLIPVLEDLAGTIVQDVSMVLDVAL